MPLYPLVFGCVSFLPRFSRWLSPFSYFRRRRFNVSSFILSNYFLLDDVPSFLFFFYRVNPETGIIDYEDLARLAGLFKPAMLVCGGSAYPREWDYAKFREIADANGALLLW